MDEYLRFENAIFCSSNCNFLTFSAHNLSLLLIFKLFFIFNNVLTTVNTTAICNYNFTKNHWISNPVFSVQYFAFLPLSSMHCLNLIITNTTPGG